MIKILEENVSKQDLKDFLYYGMSVDDKQLYRQVNESQSNIFQFSGGTAADMVRRAQPVDFAELTCINALSRPGSSFSFDDFVINGTDSSKYPKIIAEELTDSHGCILFQESIMRLTEKLTHGRAKGEATRKLLKSLGKAKKKQEDLDAWKNLIKIIREETQGVLTESEIDEFTNDMLTLSAYSFNKSHAACYTYNACETLYMTRYFKPYFWAASLTYDATKLDALQMSMKIAKKDGFQILPPDVNESFLHFTPLEDGIRFGLNEIKGIGEVPALEIIQNRKYDSIIDFIIKTLGTKINKRITLSLIGAGAFDNLIPEGERKKWFLITSKFYEKKKTKKNPEILKELWEEIIESCSNGMIELDNSFITFHEKTSAEEYMKLESIYLGGEFFHGRFSSEIIQKIDKLVARNMCLRDFSEIRAENSNSAFCPVYCSSYRYHTQRNGQEMCFLDCEDASGESVSIPIFGSYWEFVKEKFFAQGYYLMKLFAKDDGQIMFGFRSFITSPETKRQCMIRWDIAK